MENKALQRFCLFCIRKDGMDSEDKMKSDTVNTGTFIFYTHS